MKNFRYNVIFRPEPKGGFTVIVPSLPGCISYGKNLEEAKKMAEEAINLYIESLKARKEIVPSDNQDFITTIDINSPSFANAKVKYAQAKGANC
ncbi:type II toxin-antitoxin system HicB family antitoxin [Candidatus Parcubacteria bacterium]|nr:type II toxin-antitoxin system HicB family antitoxin [Candidatus Parcubacteria bacterium]